MTAVSSKSGAVSIRYAAALLDMAAEANAVAQVETDIAELGAMIDASDEFRTMILNPLFGRAQQQRAILAIADKAKFQPLTRNFLGVLADNRRLSELPGIVRAFRSELTRRRGEVEARVVSAHALSDKQAKALQAQLSKVLGSNVTLNVDVDRDLLGGMVVTVGSTMIDDSVRRKLERLKRAMTTGSNQNQTLASKEVG